MAGFNTTIIDGEFFISHLEIASFITVVELSRCDEDDKESVLNKREILKNNIKASLIVMDSIPNTGPIVIRRNLHAYANKTAFYTLVQHYNWDEAISQPILAALGEFGLTVAQEVQLEMQHNSEEAA
mgnify:CR=1 FL=1